MAMENLSPPWETLQVGTRATITLQVPHTPLIYGIFQQKASWVVKKRYGKQVPWTLWVAKSLEEAQEVILENIRCFELWNWGDFGPPQRGKLRFFQSKPLWV